MDNYEVLSRMSPEELAGSIIKMLDTQRPTVKGRGGPLLPPVYRKNIRRIVGGGAGQYKLPPVDTLVPLHRSVEMQVERYMAVAQKELEERQRIEAQKAQERRRRWNRREEV